MSTYSARVTKEEGLRMVCETDRHSMVLDEPISYGGTDLAMNPVEALLSALGACECMNAWIFAEKFKIKLNKISFDVEGEIVRMEKEGDCIPLTFDSIHTKVTVDADNTPEEIEQFINYIELRCPVRNTIINAVPCTCEIILE